MKKESTAVVVAFLIAFVVSCASEAFGSGFAIYTQGTNALGEGLSAVAHADDASVIFWNPALMTALSNSQAQAGVTFLFPKLKMISDYSGKEISMKVEIFAPPYFFATYKINNSMTAGLGAFSHFR